ncbi:hypothetical protein [Myroides odoratus]|uniref:hypothetical protein n=1 Tax=Myroides odoratus TaxID=256 RepID=UPI0039AF1813
MRKSKKTIAVFLLAIGVLSMSSSYAQKETKPYYPKGFRIGFGLNGGISTNSDYDAVFGADARLQYDLSKETSLTLTSGYTHLKEKHDQDLGLIPVKAGFKHFMTKNFYVMGEAGAGFGTHKESGNTFIWSPSIGYANKYIDLSFRYERYNDYHVDQIGLRAAYGFSLKNYKKKTK